jgi:ketosteroid isomerase-like protein
MSEYETAVRDLVEEYAAAMRAADADRLASCHLPGAEVFDLAPPLRRSFDAEGMRAWFAGHGGGPLGYELRDLTVAAGPDTGWAHCLTRMHAPGFELWFRVSYGVRRVAGRWLIAHVHESTPFHMDGSYAAATGLTPE